MSNSWQGKTQGPSSFHIQADEKLLDETGVILMYGTNTFGDRIYSYIEITMRKLQDMKAAMDRNENVKPSDFGSVLAAGRGEPSQDIKDEMAAKYNLIPIPTRNAPPTSTKPVFAPPPRFSYGDDED